MKNPQIITLNPSHVIPQPLLHLPQPVIIEQKVVSSLE